MTQTYDQLAQKCMQCRKYLLSDEEVVNDPIYENCLSHASCVIWATTDETNIDKPSVTNHLPNECDAGNTKPIITNNVNLPQLNPTTITNHEDDSQPDDNPAGQTPLK